MASLCCWRTQVNRQNGYIKLKGHYSFIVFKKVDRNQKGKTWFTTKKVIDSYVQQH